MSEGRGYRQERPGGSSGAAFLLAQASRVGLHPGALDRIQLVKSCPHVSLGAHIRDKAVDHTTG